MAEISQVHIRDATDTDREAVLALMLEAYGQYAKVMPEEGWKQYAENIKESVDREGPIARILAELDGEIVGSVQLFASSETAYGAPELGITSPIIRLLATSPRARGKGVATALIKESARRSVELGADTLHLHTSDMMASAVKLYERLGFERARDKEMQKGETLVKCYRLQLKETALLG
ncbi:GNAT family N-acetyltransferase [Paenibacillus sp. NEAU-GSW1]|uniref:GNAT family N-acetyltransferase n=1 Tax=Paenibacillus sp. NEAU-GSW1 TaxID=2682486 RepID=UPI0012E3011C|nr:GNAT family N-acetyltransferase [Paenibacillus sp. NEAU-GSW1]MUT67196.1 GNAT family N-acetyltransferase [Paenibacillus sp. NEAU-GSW1]